MKGVSGTGCASYTMTANVWVTGGTGLLGSHVVRRLADHDCLRVWAPSRTDLDVTMEGSIEIALARHQPDVIVHCAAYTDVDSAEDQYYAYLLNTHATALLAMAAARVGAFLIYISTDYVFSGSQKEVYETSPCDPVNWYGKTKWMGEQIIAQYCKRAVTVRTAGLYGVHAQDRRKPMHTFPHRVMDQIAAGKVVQIPYALESCVTYAPDLANIITSLVLSYAENGCDMPLLRSGYSILHACGPPTSLLMFASELANMIGEGTVHGVEVVQPAPHRAPRPAPIRLATRRLRSLGYPPPRPLSVVLDATTFAADMAEYLLSRKEYYYGTSAKTDYRDGRCV